MDSPEIDNASPKTIEDYLRLSLIKIKKYFKGGYMDYIIYSVEDDQDIEEER